MFIFEKFVMITDGPELINIQSRAIKLALVMLRLSRARAANCPLTRIFLLESRARVSGVAPSPVGTSPPSAVRTARSPRGTSWSAAPTYYHTERK